MRTQQELLVDCLERLNRLAFPYMLAGSTASNYWGVPQSTHELDFVLMLRPAEVERLAAGFREGFSMQLKSIRSAFSPPYRFHVIDESSALKVDFRLLRDDLFERAAFDRRKKVTLFGTLAWVTTAEDVILHQLYWHRLSPSDRQLLDAAGVFAVQADALDLSHLRHWAAVLRVERELEDLSTGKLMPKTS